MKRVELLIEEVRELTGNQRYDSNSGTSQYRMVRSLKNAQVEIYKNIVNAQNEFFKKDGDAITVVSGQEGYSYPSDIYLMNIETIQWSPESTANARGFVNLVKSITKDRVTTESGYPFGYILRGSTFLLTPPLSNGYLFPTYIRRIPDLEKRSGQISAITISGGQITALTLDSAEASFDQTYLNKLQKLCIVNKFGEKRVLNVEFASVASNGVVTLGSNHTLGSGETAAVGDYVTAGGWTYNTSELPDVCEAHLIKHAVYETKYGDASSWTKAAIDDAAMSMATLLESLKKPSRDNTEVPITNTDYLSI